MTYKRIETSTGAVLELWDDLDVWTNEPRGTMMRVSVNAPDDRRKAEVLLDPAAQEAFAEALLESLKGV